MAKLTQEELDRIKDRTFNLAVKGIRFTVENIDLVTINGMPLKDFLEGVAWLGESSYRLQTLITLAHKYGVELTDETDLFRCDHELTKAIEPRIVPPGMMWPRFEDGEPVKFGDEIRLNNRCGKVNSVKFYSNGNRSIKAVDEDGNWGFVLTGKGEFIKRPEPKQDTLQDVIRSIIYELSIKDHCEDDAGFLWKIIERLKALEERMGGDGESKADSPVEISKQKTCPHCGSSHVITTKVITIGEGRYSEAETDLCLTCGYDFTNTRS